MYSWHAKVHKSGTKVAIFNGSKLVKVVEASKETFEPIEAQKFAESLITELQERVAVQMTAPSQQPSVATESELQSSSMAAVSQQATGKGAGDEQPVAAAPVQEELITEEQEIENEDKFASENQNLRGVIASLKKKLAQERNERAIERKARRGLAIAKQMVVEGSLEDSYDAIKSKVAEITKLEESEIDRLERKIAGEHEFVSIDDAQKELRRQDRIARINRQAAAEAQDDGDEEQADALDRKADEAEAKKAHIASVIEEMSKIAEETPAPVVPETEEKKEEEKADEAAPAPVVEEAKEATVVTAEETPAPVVPETEEKKEEEKADEAAPASEEIKEEASSNSTEKLAALARKYRSIAANHRKMAEAAESQGDIESADKQDAMADDAEEKAEDIEKKLAECKSSETPATPAPEQTEEKSDEATETPVEEVVETEDKKEAARKNPGQTVTASNYTPLKREGEAVEEFGIDKNASLVEQNDYADDPEVAILSQMWRSAQKDEE